MGMLLNCDKCFAVDYHRLNLQTNEVVCSKCSKNVEVTGIAKTVLKDSKQVMESVRSESEMECDHCKSVSTPYLKKLNAIQFKVFCGVCDKENARQSRFFVDVWKNKPGVKIIQSTPAERQASNNPMRFNKVETPVLKEASAEKTIKVVAEPEPEFVAPPVTNDHEVVAPEPQLENEPELEFVANESEENLSPERPEQVTEGEEAARRRAEALMNANLVVRPKAEMPFKITESDIAISGLSDYAEPSDE